jgi:hypothetical protein
MTANKAVNSIIKLATISNLIESHRLAVALGKKQQLFK